MGQLLLARQERQHRELPEQQEIGLRHGQLQAAETETVYAGWMTLDDFYCLRELIGGISRLRQ